MSCNFKTAILWFLEFFKEKMVREIGLVCLMLVCLGQLFSFATAIPVASKYDDLDNMERDVS